MIFKDYERIVFAGDSVTDMDSAQPVGEGLFESLGKGYVRVFENLMVAAYPEINLRITNAGISGNTSRDLLKRFDRDVVDLKPDWVAICIGINDVWRQFDVPGILEEQVQPDEYEKNIDTMILKIKDQVKGIFILSPYYMEPNRADKMRARMDEYVSICRELAKKYNCKFIDFQALYERFCNIRHSSCIAWDRVHPNQMGSTLMAREILRECDYDFNKFI